MPRSKAELAGTRMKAEPITPTKKRKCLNDGLWVAKQEETGSPPASSGTYGVAEPAPREESLDTSPNARGSAATAAEQNTFPIWQQRLKDQPSRLQLSLPNPCGGCMSQNLNRGMMESRASMSATRVDWGGVFMIVIRDVHANS